MIVKSESLSDYFDALARLQAGRPIIVSKGTKITNDSVALEAGRGKGSIKRSRPSFALLIEEIKAAAEVQANDSPEKQQHARMLRIKGAAEKYRSDVDIAMASLVSRIYEIHELRKRVRELEQQVQDLTERVSHKAGKNVELLKPRGV